MNMRNMKLLFLTLFLLACQQDRNNYNHVDGVAIKGYDPVSYFDRDPKKGDPSITYSFDGLTYRFASEANKDKFKANPERYKPAYGG